MMTYEDIYFSKKMHHEYNNILIHYLQYNYNVIKYYNIIGFI
jgi:hypothetical protein